MTSLNPANSFNVEAALGVWITGALAVFDVPPFMDALPPVILDATDITASLPCYAVYHIPGNLSTPWLGHSVGANQLGGRQMGIMEVSCYVSKENSNWRAVQRFMRDTVKSALLSTKTVLISDALSDPFSPSDTQYKIDLGEVTEVTTEADPNPSVERVRVLIEYVFTYRVDP